MENMSHFNYLVLLAPTALYLVLGWVWYYLLFGKTWCKLAKVHPKELKGEVLPYIGAIISGLLITLGLQQFLYCIQATAPVHVICVSTILWLGFVFPTLLSGFFWEKRPFKLLLIDSTYFLVAMVAMAMTIVYLS